jgi:Uma2 family endonuclease
MFIASDLNLYYNENHVNWYKRPDWFLVLGVSRLYQGNELRLSYVRWQEKVSPLVVVELLSEGTEEEDLGLTAESANKPPTKWRVYERILRIPYYFVFSRYTNQLRGFRLIGNRYREQSFTESRFWIPELELGIGLWSGDYQGCQRIWLRWYNANGDLLLTPEEEKELALEQVEQERLAKELAIEQIEQERFAKEIALQKAERLAERLRVMGINPDDL